MKRKASARWQGTAKEGSGTLSVQSGTLNEVPYSFVARFGDGKGTNPEELIAAAHAGASALALSFMLNNGGFTADAIDTEANHYGAGERQLDGDGDSPDDARANSNRRAQIRRNREQREGNCPISRLLNATITFDGRRRVMNLSSQ
jgi:osmotically inducible protein OsmC